MIAGEAAITLLATGIGDLESGTHSPSELFVFLLFTAFFTRPVGSFASIYDQCQIARGTLALLDQVYSTELEPGRGTGKKVDRTKAAPRFEQASFGYRGRPAVLERLDILNEPGEFVARTGENGIGTSPHQTSAAVLRSRCEPHQARW